MKNCRFSWLGYLPDGTHDKTLTGTEQECIALLRQHVGRDNAVSARALAVQVIGGPGPRDMRDLRYLVNHLIITHRQAIMCLGGTGGGYFMPASPGEVAVFHRVFHRRAVTGLIKAARGSKAAFVDSMVQMSFFLDSPDGEDIAKSLAPDPEFDSTPAFVSMITRFLDHMSADPQTYAKQIAELQARFGNIFVPKATLLKIKNTTDQLQMLLKEVA